MRLAVGITLAVLFGAAVLTYLLLDKSASDTASSSVATSTSLPSPTSEYWTEERMRNAKGPDMMVGPDAYELALGVGGLLAVAGVIVVLIRRKR